MQNMRDCDKPLIVIYINVKNVNDRDMLYYLENASNAIGRGFDDTVQILFMPTFDKSGESRVEVLNPRYVPEGEYKQIVNDINEKYKEIIKSIKENGSNA